MSPRQYRPSPTRPIPLRPGVAGRTHVVACDGAPPNRSGCRPITWVCGGCCRGRREDAFGDDLLQRVVYARRLALQSQKMHHTEVAESVRVAPWHATSLEDASELRGSRARATHDRQHRCPRPCASGAPRKSPCVEGSLRSGGLVAHRHQRHAGGFSQCRPQASEASEQAACGAPAAIARCDPLVVTSRALHNLGSEQPIAQQPVPLIKGRPNDPLCTITCPVVAQQ